MHDLILLHLVRLKKFGQTLLHLQSLRKFWPYPFALKEA